MRRYILMLLIVVVQLPSDLWANGEHQKLFQLESKDVQIVFADLQPDLVNQSKTVKPANLAASAGALAKVGKILGIPMSFCIVPLKGKPGRLIPSLLEYANETNSFNRVIASPFTDQKFVESLASKKRKILIVSGYATEVAVLQTTVDAIAQGYTVYVPVDGIGSSSERTESAAIRQIERAGGITTSVLSLVTRIAPDLSKPPGSLTIKAVLGSKAP